MSLVYGANVLAKASLTVCHVLNRWLQPGSPSSHPAKKSVYQRGMSLQLLQRTRTADKSVTPSGFCRKQQQSSEDDHSSLNHKQRCAGSVVHLLPQQGKPTTGPPRASGHRGTCSNLQKIAVDCLRMRSMFACSRICTRMDTVTYLSTAILSSSHSARPVGEWKSAFPSKSAFYLSVLAACTRPRNRRATTTLMVLWSAYAHLKIGVVSH